MSDQSRQDVFPGDGQGNPAAAPWEEAPFPEPDEMIVPDRQPRRRRARREQVWRETLQVEVPPRLNLLSVGIGCMLGVATTLVCISRTPRARTPGVHNPAPPVPARPEAARPPVRPAEVPAPKPDPERDPMF